LDTLLLPDSRDYIRKLTLKTEAIKALDPTSRRDDDIADPGPDADSDALIGAYENRLRSREAAKVEAKEKIANCGRPLADFGTTYRTAMEFLENPSKMWVFGDLVDKRSALKLTFKRRIRYEPNEGH
jgi:hypothetical protein